MTSQRDKVPAGQRVVRGFPVLHVGAVPDVDLATWRLRVDGEVSTPRSFRHEELRAMPSSTVTADFHCVTTWSILDRKWTGVRFSDFAKIVE